MKDKLSASDLLDELNSQTAKLSWSEVEPHFARGAVIHVCSNLDLVTVSTCIIKDDKAAMEKWMREGKVALLSDEDAQKWEKQNTELWAIVIAPWVVVQENQHQQDSAPH